MEQPREELSRGLPEHQRAGLSVRLSGVPPLCEVRKREEKMSPINTKSDRVVRGGSWSNFAWFCRAGSRSDFAPGLRYDFLGFRLSTRYVRGRKK